VCIWGDGMSDLIPKWKLWRDLELDFTVLISGFWFLLGLLLGMLIAEGM
jgi:hypothetical protein